MNNKQKLLELVSENTSNSIERAKERLARREFAKLSILIAMSMLERLEELNWSQKKLAEKMNVSPQLVNKWLKGHENFTIETLTNLGKVLGTDLITVVKKPKEIKMWSTSREEVYLRIPAEIDKQNIIPNGAPNLDYLKTEFSLAK